MTKSEESDSEIQKCFRDKNVFVTGATGFIGHVLVEKLLRSCSLNKIYLLVREKKNKDPKIRLREMFSSPLFKTLWDENPNFMDKVLLIVGDCVEPNLGISESNEQFLVANIDIVIHCAATINLNGPLRHATFINVRSTRDLLKMAQRMHKLKSFVHVSTTFSNPNQPSIKEIIYDCPMPGETLINMAENMTDSFVNSITEQCIGDWPNTYTLSKCVAENIVKEYGQNMPISIARPCIVGCTAEEPVQGWFCNLKSVPGLCMGVGIGAVHAVYASNDCPAVIAPGDKVANLIIASAWHASKTRSGPSIPVFNYIPNNMAPPLSYKEGMDCIINSIENYKLYSEKEIWKPSITITNSNILFTILFFLYHYVPAFIADGYLCITGKKPKITKLCRKMNVMIREMQFFGSTPFKFDDTNVQKLIRSQSSKDKKMFNMDLSKMRWDDYFIGCIKGIKKYTLKDSVDATLGLQRHKKVMMIYYIANGILYSFILYSIYCIMYIVWKNFT